jgi:uncharacterized protein YegL
MDPMIPVPGGEIAKRQLHFIWLADCSGSMAGKKIASLNQAVREALPEIRKALENHPEVQVYMRAIRFSDKADWHVGFQPVPLESFEWPDLKAGGSTATAQALRLLAVELEVELMPRRGLPPVVILISDGFCTDPKEEYDGALAALNSMPWGQKAVRLAIAIGDESEYDEVQLRKFLGPSTQEIGLLKAHSTEQLVGYIKWASVTASVGATVARSRIGVPGAEETNVALPPPPVIPVSPSNSDVF